jgi:hypothetical protein
LESSTPCPGGGGGKRKRAFRWAFGFLYRRAASFCRFLVRRFVVFVVSSFVVSSLYRVFYMSSCRSLVRRFGVLSFCRFVVSSFRRSLNQTWMGATNARIQPAGVQNESKFDQNGYKIQQTFRNPQQIIENRQNTNPNQAKCDFGLFLGVVERKVGSRTLRPESAE